MINSIIRHYGLPDVIRVEVAKDLKRSKHEKAIIAATNKANKDSNEQAKKDLVAFYGLPNDAHVSSADFEKMWLYREQFGQDPYTGKGINLERMLNDRDYVEIDHILPFSRSCDDSKSNKVLCLTKSNRDKANRTPYEWMTSGEPSAPDFGDFCRRMDAWAGKGKSAHYTKSKLSKLKNSTFGKEEQKFIDRNLNDTRYMSRQLAMWVRECLPIPDMQGKLLNPKGDRVLVALLAGKVDLGLRDRPRKVEVRYLDTSSCHGFGLCVLDTGNDRNLAEPEYPCERAIIVENRDTFNSFPMEGIFSSNSVVLLGNGNAGPSSISQIPWLRTIHEIYYWGDMDTDGLEILARYRQAGLPCESILMTLDDFKRYEEYGTRYSKDNGQVFVRCEDEALAAFLTDAERGLYLALCGSGCFELSKPS